MATANVAGKDRPIEAYADVYDDTAQTVDILFPWPGGSRGLNRTDDTGLCEIVTEGGQKLLKARNQREINDPENLIEQQAPLPQGAPLYDFVEDAQGCRLA